MTTFEDFLREKHAQQYSGTDDLMDGDCEKFICELEPDDLIKYADKFANQIRKETIDKAKSIILKGTKDEFYISDIIKELDEVASKYGIKE